MIIIQFKADMLIVGGLPLTYLNCSLQIFFLITLGQGCLKSASQANHWHSDE